MRRPLAVLALAGLLVLAGCTSGTTLAGTTPADSPERPPLTTHAPGSDQTSVDGPPTDNGMSTDDRRLAPKPLPDPPAELTRENVVRFVERYEQAYAWNRELTNNTIEIAINPVRTAVTNATDAGYVVHLEVGFSKTVLSDGDRMVGDGFYTVNYLVNDTAILRAQAGGQARPGPDPHNGTILGG